jgi:hypothetical protein
MASCDSDEKPNGPGVIGGSDDGSDEPEVDQPDEDTAENGPDETSVTCNPGSTVGCLEENTPAIEVCSDDGTEIVESSCRDGAVCRSGECVDVFCIPGQRRCESDKQAQVCAESGESFKEVETCGDGAICEGGYCLNRCEFAREEKSYIGCEYWGVELENHLLTEERETGEPLPPDRRPPYAIVLANTSSEYTADISVLTGKGEYAEALGTRTVGADVRYPGTTYVDVSSEIVDEDGDRIKGPIEGEIKDIELPKNSLMTLLFPKRTVPFAQSMLKKVAYKVEASQPVVAYQFNPFCCNYNYTNDASLLIPKNVLTQDYGYLSYAVWAGAESRLRQPNSSTLTVVGTEADTDVTVELPEDEFQGRPLEDVIYPFPQSLLESRVQAGDDGVIETTLQPFEVLNVAASGAEPVVDLTGTFINSSKPVAVFAGHTCAYVPFNMSACDHLESQLFPMETWGERFLAAPLKIREDNPTAYREGTYWKFLARADGTTIETGLDFTDRKNIYNPAAENVEHCREFAETPSNGTFRLNKGESCEFGTHQPFVVTSNEPIQLGAFLSGQSSTTGESAEFGDHNGDPAFFIVPPSEQYRQSYSFLTPSTYHQNYVSVTIAKGVELTLDGEAVDIGQLDPIPIEGTNEILLHVPVDAGPHQISANSRFGIVVYGFDDYVSYSYTGGLNLRKISTLEDN